jgi:hypothetical protein
MTLQCPKCQTEVSPKRPGEVFECAKCGLEMTYPYPQPVSPAVAYAELRYESMLEGRKMLSSLGWVWASVFSIVLGVVLFAFILLALFGCGGR